MDNGGELLLVVIIFLAVAAVMLALGFFFLARTRRFLRTALDATGTIVDLVESSGSEGGTVYQAVVEFQTADGRSVRWQETMASNPPAGEPGHDVAMKYDPADPSKARIAKATRMWFMPVLFGALGLLFLGLGVALTVAGLVA